MSKYTSRGNVAEELINYDAWYAGILGAETTRLRLVSYVLIQLAPGTTKTATEAISKIKGVRTAHAVTGPFDVIAYVEVPDLPALSDLILAKIQNIEGVQKTQTAIVVTPDVLRPGLK